MTFKYCISTDDVRNKSELDLHAYSYIQLRDMIAAVDERGQQLVLLCRNAPLLCIVLCCVVLCCVVLCCVVLCCVVLYCIVLYCIVSYCIVLYCILEGQQTSLSRNAFREKWYMHLTYAQRHECVHRGRSLEPVTGSKLGDLVRTTARIG